MKRPICIIPSFSVDVHDVARALRAAGMSVVIADRTMIVHKPARDLTADAAAIDADLPALLRPQCGPLHD
jgi:hypothetical protein